MKKLLIPALVVLLSGLTYYFVTNDKDQDLAISNDSKTPEELYIERANKKKLAKLNGKHKFKGPDELAIYHQQMRTSVTEKEPGYPVDYKARAYQKANQNVNTARFAEDLNWVERGPNNVPGRTRAIINHLDSPDSWLAGSVAGGIWLTQNAGVSWQHLTPDWPNMSVSCLVQSESNPDIIYAGTGEQYAGYNSVRGDGIFKSTDRGATWELLSSTSNNNDFRNVNRLVVDPANPQVIVAVTSIGFWEVDETIISKIMKSTDGGQTWTETYSSNNHIEHIVAAPSDFNIQYASINEYGAIRSSDAGATWVDISTELVVNGRTELAVSPNDPNKVYASSESDIISSGSVLYVSNNGGQNWNLAVEQNGGNNIDLLGGQGFYDNTIAVHPFDDNVVYVGGVNLFKNKVSSLGASQITTLLGAEENGTEAFMDYINFTDADFNNGSVVIELNEGTNITENDFVAVELRFGPGKSQKAHRFRVPAGTTSGFPLGSYIYGDYTDVPFEVWDVTNNQQLMVSYRDQENNSEFNLNAPDEAGGDNADSREYLFIHATPYNPTTPDPSIAQVGGVSDKMMYFMWPVLAEGGTWDGNSLPESTLKINWGAIQAKQKATTVVADAYGNFAPTGQPVTNSSAIIHPDHHNILVQVVDEDAETFRLIVTNDGGVYYSNTSVDPGVNDGDWTFAGNGYNTTQFYGVDKSPVSDIYIGGTQDNGTYRSQLNEPSGTSAWSLMFGGDGFEVVWNKGDNDRHVLGSVYWNQIRKSTSRGIQWSSATVGLSDVGQNSGPFITKLSNSPKDPDLVFAVGVSGVWKSTNFGDTWSLTSIEDPTWFNTTFLDVEVSQSNSNFVMAGTGMSDNHGLFLSTDKGESFTKLPTFSTDLGVMSGLHSHPAEDSTFYALFSFYGKSKIFRTEDLGQNWEDISEFRVGESQNGFPDVAAYCLLVREDSTNIIWVGTDVGLVESRDNGQTWAFADNGLERAPISDIKYWDGEVIIGTHGRGVWTARVDGSEQPTSVNEFTVNSTIEAYPNPTTDFVNLRANFAKQPKTLNLKVYSYLGFEILSKRISKAEYQNGSLNHKIDLSELSSGAYIINLESDLGAIQSTVIKK